MKTLAGVTLTARETAIVVAAIEFNMTKSGGPAPSADNLRYFTRKFAVESLKKATPHFKSSIQRHAENIIKKIEEAK